MRRRLRHSAMGGAGLLIVGFLSLAVVAPRAGAAPVTAKDPGGDTVTESVEESITAPRADIIETAAESRPDGITLSFRLSELVDPVTDPNWTDENGYSNASWDLDVNGDGKRDFEIDYSFDPDVRAMASSLYRFSTSFRPPEGCDPAASFTATSGYTVVVDPKCLGNAAAFTYRVALSYNTNSKDDTADVATDVSPDKGWSEPVTVTLPEGVTPGTLPTTTTTMLRIAPSPAAGSEQPAPAQRGATTPTTAKRIAPQQAAPRPRPSSAAPAAAAATAPDLVNTGLGDRTLRLAGFAFGIMLIGIGILFGNRRTAIR